MKYPQVQGEASADRTDRQLDVDGGVVLSDRLMHTARTDLALVKDESLHLRAFHVVPLGLARNDGPHEPANVVVLVGVDVRRLPPKQPLLADVERARKDQAVSELPVVDEAFSNFGARLIPCSCILTTSDTRSRRSA